MEKLNRAQALPKCNKACPPLGGPNFIAEEGGGVTGGGEGEEEEDDDDELNLRPAR